MNSSALLHVLSIVHGLAAGVACATVFYIAGLTLLPRRWDGRVLRVVPGMVGAAAYVICCWYAVMYGIPVARVVTWFPVATLLLAAMRYRRVAQHFSDPALRRALGSSVAMFAALYALAYVLTMPPVTPDYLPIRWLGNLDLMTYARYTRYFLALGPSNLGSFSYRNFVYLQTPGVFYLVGALSWFFDLDPLRAAMPIQHALTAFSGALVGAISRSIFGLSARAAFGIAGIFVTGVFFRYLAAEYFLSTLMAMPVMLSVLALTVQAWSSRTERALFVALAACYALLLMIYPFLMFATIGLQAAAVGAMLLAGLQRREGDKAAAVFSNALRIAAAAVLAFLVVAISFWTRLKWSTDMVIALSEKGVAGWPLSLIVPQAMFGLPLASTRALHLGASPGPWAIGVYLFIAATLVFAMFNRRLTPRLSVGQCGFAGVLAAAVIVYCLYYSMLGRSYQQWKFASYTVLPVMFVAYAVALRLFLDSKLSHAESPRTRRLVAAVPAFLAAIIVFGNLGVHASADLRLMRMRGSLRRVAELNRMPQFSEIAIRMSELRAGLATWVALYYLPDKNVHVVSAYFRPGVGALSLEEVSPQRPLLMQDYDCRAVGHIDTMTIDELGCLIFEPPSITVGEAYPFNRTFLFLEFAGLTSRREQGRLNRRSTVGLKIMADPQRTDVRRDLYVNVLLVPQTPKPSPVAIRLDSGAYGDAKVQGEQWVSVPVRSSDWTGNRLWMVRVNIEVPAGTRVLFKDLSVTEIANASPLRMRADGEEGPGSRPR